MTVPSEEDCMVSKRTAAKAAILALSLGGMTPMRCPSPMAVPVRQGGDAACQLADDNRAGEQLVRWNVLEPVAARGCRSRRWPPRSTNIEAPSKSPFTT